MPATVRQYLQVWSDNKDFIRECFGTILSGILVIKFLRILASSITAMTGDTVAMVIIGDAVEAQFLLVYNGHMTGESITSSPVFTLKMRQ